MTDLEFITRFENTEYKYEEWTHEAHIRMGWYYVSTFGVREALEKSRSGIQKLNAVIGTQGLGYHETITQFFIQLIDHAVLVSRASTWEEFRERNSFLLQSKILQDYYSRAAIALPKSKVEFVAPDLKPLPVAKLAVRDAGPSDAGLVEAYFRSLTPSDHARMQIDPAKFDFGPTFQEGFKKPKQMRVFWEIEGIPCGMMNIRLFKEPIEPGLHLHVLGPKWRGRGLGEKLFLKSCKRLSQLSGYDTLFCEPASTNPFPNKLFKKLGIPIEKTYRTVPSPICYEHEVNRYRITKERLEVV